MKNLYTLALILFSLLLSCNKDEIKIDPDNLLIGTWNYSGYQNNINIYARSPDFADKHCYRFNPDGSLVERNIAGFCATPPVSFANYDGTWTVLNDTVVEINVKSFDGIRAYRLDLNSVTRDSLKIEVIPVR